MTSDSMIKSGMCPADSVRRLESGENQKQIDSKIYHGKIEIRLKLEMNIIVKCETVCGSFCIPIVNSGEETVAKFLLDTLTKAMSIMGATSVAHFCALDIFYRGWRSPETEHIDNLLCIFLNYYDSQRFGARSNWSVEDAAAAFAVEALKDNGFVSDEKEMVICALANCPTSETPPNHRA